MNNQLSVKNQYGTSIYYIAKILKTGLYFSFFILHSSFQLHSQALPITIDSQFDDWTAQAIEITDADNDGDDIEILRMAVANDDDHLFIRLELDTEVNLTDDHNLTLYIDTDLDPNTGDFFNGIGAELEINLGDREVFYKLPSGQGNMSLNDIHFRHQPSVSDKIFEMAFDLNAISNAGADLFTANGVSLVWKDETGPIGDALPDNGSVFTYLFDETDLPDIEPIELNKENPNALRLLAWNTLQDGLDDVERQERFNKILSVVKPDIVTFNECWDINPAQVATFMNGAVPLPNFQSWKTIKIDDGNVTASRYPILENWYILPGQRLTASLIDIPSSISEKDLLVINAHFRCCGNDFDRQREADAFVEFIQDVKTPGGVIDVPEGTPFVLSGDLNLVGKGQQLTTLLTGDIVNNNQFGPGGTMDWDDSDLVDVIGRHTDERFAFTWENRFSSFPPSRIDYHIISGSVMSVDKSYTLQPKDMSSIRLNQYGLLSNDAEEASDHLPRVSDLILPNPVSTVDLVEKHDFSVFPNPINDFCKIEMELQQPAAMAFTLQDASGRIIRKWEMTFSAGQQVFSFKMAGLASGVYFLKVGNGGDYGVVRLVKN